MSIKQSALQWRDGDTPCEGVYYTPEAGDKPMPLVLLCPAWDGVGDEIKGKAARLAEEGYITLTVDVLGNAALRALQGGEEQGGLLLYGLGHQVFPGESLFYRLLDDRAGDLQ